MGALIDIYFLLAYIHSQKTEAGHCLMVGDGKGDSRVGTNQLTLSILLIFTKLILPTGNTDGFEISS